MTFAGERLFPNPRRGEEIPVGDLMLKGLPALDSPFIVVVKKFQNKPVILPVSRSISIFMNAACVARPGIVLILPRSG